MATQPHDNRRSPLNREISRLIQDAVALSRAGHFEQCEQLCWAILRERSTEATTLHLLGVCLLQQGRYAEAEQALAKCLRAQPNQAAALTNRGIALQGLKRLNDALDCYTEALALDPRQPATLHMHGLALIELRRYDEALEDFDRALDIAPDFAEIWCSRGNALIQMRQYESALGSLDQAEALRPDYGEALSNRSIALNLLRRHEQARAAAERAVRLLPDRAMAHRNLADALAALGRYTEALESYGQAVSLDRRNHLLVAAKADLLCQLGHAQEAREHYAQALAMLEESTLDILNSDPANAATDANVRWRLAELSFGRGEVLADIEDYEAATDAFAQATKWRDDFVYAHWAEALVRLRLGDYEEGWRKYEWRRRKPDFRNVLRQFAAPEWTGTDDPAGLRILLHAEQGLGDALQFCRYAPLLAERGAQVIVAAHPPLKCLLATLPGVTVVADGDELPPFDRHCPILSLPFAFRTTLANVPAAVPYLQADPERVVHWAQVLGRQIRPRVGLVWSGNPQHANDRARSIPPEALAPLVGFDTDFIALNKQVREAEADTIERLGLWRLGETLTDFADTAALIENLDLVITVDTSVAHLAGALARPVWILLDTRSDFRWLVDREDSPWYPTARLLRQRRRGDWGEVIERVASDLAAFLSTAVASNRNPGRRPSGSHRAIRYARSH